MERVSRFRAHILLAIFILVVGFFAFKLYDEQIIKTGGSTDNSTTYVTRTRVKAARGDILDRNGNVLVSNRASYDLTINHNVLLNTKGTLQTKMLPGRDTSSSICPITTLTPILLPPCW